MQALARLRASAARLRSRTSTDRDAVLALVDDALELSDAMRLECSALQQRAAELERQFQTRAVEVSELLDQMPGALVQTDGAGTIVDANRAAVALLGLSRARLQNELLLYFTEDRAAFASLVRHLPHHGEPVSSSARIRPRERAPFDAAITLMRDPREEDARWLWFIERVSVAQSAARTPPRRGPAATGSEQSAN